MAAARQAGRRSPDSGPRRSGLALALLAILFVSINALAAAWLTSARVDLTEDRLYTLSDSTKSLLESVMEPITFRLYLSSELAQHVPALGIYAKRVRNLLGEYRNLSNGMVRLEVLDPAPFSDVEDRAVAAGLQGVPVVTGGDSLYFGLVGTNTTDDREAIPFMRVDREAFLEYDLSQMLYALATPDPTVVGILTTLPTDGTLRMNATGQQEPVPPYVIRTQIGQIFETRFLGAAVEEVPREVDVLLVVHPKEMTARTRFAIDQYLLAGGAAMIFVDPYAEAEGMEGQMVGQTIDGSNLADMFAAWGLIYDPLHVVGDRLTARKVLAQDQNRPVEYLPWLELRGPNISRTSPITSGIDTVAVASAGHIRAAENATIKLDPLLVTSPGSALIDSSKVQGFRNPLRLLREFEPTDDRYIVAARVTGTVRTAFPDGMPVETDESATSQETQWTRPILTESAEPLNVIVIADADVLVDRFWVIMRDFVGGQVPAPTADNGDFVLNGIEALSGSDALTGLRGRGTANRVFDVLVDLQRKASQRFEDKERELDETLKKTERDLRDLRRRNSDGKAVFSDRDRRAMQKFQRKILQLRAELRAVRRSITQDFERLEIRLWLFNIVLVPVLVAIFAIVLALWRSYRRRDRAHEAAAG